MEEHGRWDGVFYQMVQQGGGYEYLFDEVFGWLRRKTDFFTDQKKAEKVIANAGEKHILQYKKDQENRDQDDKARKEREAKRKAEIEKNEKEKADKLAREEEARLNAPPEDLKKKEVEVKEEKPDAEKTEEEKKKEEEDKEPAPKGNGGSTDKYYWTQTLEEVSVMIPMPNVNIKPKDLIIKLTTNHCFVQIKGQDPIFDADWPEHINSEDTLWTMETDSAYSEKILKLNIAKWSTAMGWWDCVCKGEPKINTQKIQPESSKVSDIQDGEMRGQVEKMMYDMNQKQKGLPTSDEQEKHSKIQEFMKAHPEMDFSKAKIC